MQFQKINIDDLKHAKYNPSTLIACQGTDRISYTMELDEKYCDEFQSFWG